MGMGLVELGVDGNRSHETLAMRVQSFMWVLLELGAGCGGGSSEYWRIYT